MTEALAYILKALLTQWDLRDDLVEAWFHPGEHGYKSDRAGKPESSEYSPLPGRTLFVMRLAVLGVAAW